MSTLHIPLPQPDDLSSREKQDAMGAYFMMFAAMATSLPLPIINLIAAIIYYYINRKKSRYIHFHCLQSLLSQIPTTLINWGLLFWVIRIMFFNKAEFNTYFFVYLGFVILANLLYFTFSILAAVRARKGVFMYFLFFGSYTYNRVYSTENSLSYDNEEQPDSEIQQINSPPFL
jgi:uncharacterized Tic20 family protein